ncbi:hypothetical protein C3B54_11799 [Pontimonas salivibrio]|uniref:Integral membrane protein n=1 Tax=Pontimonas salivibrio TaxID=1159327 RepID=A0A2L2BQ50_9MICO|nr:hypothetical protein [Pontimonas salivibrio]AVG23778.1 hypothetical protein C3B54_11799 [Pontimonas salivibrio]
MAGGSTTRGGVFTTLASIYVVLTLAALGRSGYQIATKFSDAPTAYVLSAFAAVVYLLATVALIASTSHTTRTLRVGRIVALVALTVEALGVVGIGTLSLFRPELFPADTVWSNYGAGYLYIPLVLPFIGLWWLRSSREAR